MRPVPVAPNLRAALDALAAELPTDLATTDDLMAYRRIAAGRPATPEELTAVYGMRHEHRRVADAEVTVFHPDAVPVARVVFLHGGGLVAGNRFDGVDLVLRHAQALALEVWTLEYPLAPEAKLAQMTTIALTAVRAAAGLPVLLMGQSAGGGVAAATALRARDTDARIDGLMLVCPMLARADPLAATQFAGDPSWSPLSNATAWAAALGDRDVPPGEEQDLAGLPPTYIDAGSAELFRSAILDFSERLCQHAVPTETHIWSGGFHAFDGVGEEARVSVASHRCRRDWLERWLRDEL